MFPGALALLERSLRVDARAVGLHLARFVLMAVIYVTVIVAVEWGLFFGAPGLLFVRNIAYLNLLSMTVLGIEFFSTVITEEKEDDTLGLMLMAGIGPLSILLGKAGGRLVQALLLVVVQYPFTLLAVTMGGVTHAQVQSTYIAMLAYMVMLSGVGLLCSTLAPPNRSASRNLLILIFAYWLLPVACHRYLTGNAASLSPLVANVLGWVAESCVFFQIGTAVTTGFGETMWTRQVITNLAIGGLGFVLSWALFGLAVRNSSIEASTREMVTRSVSSSRWISPGRPWNNPIAWKDFYFVAGGKPAVLIRFLFYSTILLATAFYSHGVVGGKLTMETAKAITSNYLNLTLVALAIDAAMLVTRSLYAEIREQTFVSLLLLPISTGAILYSKLFGSLLNWVPGVICLLFGIVVLPHGLAYCVDIFKVDSRGPWLFYVAHLILLPHMAAVFAVFVRWGALPSAICTTIGSLVWLSLILVDIESKYGSRFTEVGLAIGCVCIWCHSIVWREVDILAAK